MAETRNLCAQIPLDLHAKVQEEKDELGLKLSDYVIQILNEHFEGGKTIMAATKTIAFQIPEELNQQLKEYLARKGLTQKQFFVNCIEQALKEDALQETPDYESMD